MKRPFRILLFLIGFALGGFVLFIAVMRIREWRPAPVETVYASPQGTACDTLTTGDTLRIVSWNIGYAGLGDDMDFFYDGGTRMRTSRERTLDNLHGIIGLLTREAYERQADMILLQEVDFDSRRSYGMNEYDSIRAALPGYHGWRGLNYVCDFVPIPLSAPMGRVESGLAIFSRRQPQTVIRYAYPGGFAFPVRLFNLKRCLLDLEIPVRDSTGKVHTLHIGNTHNTAYDSGELRNGELRFLSERSAEEPYSITMGDWNCHPPGYVPSRAATEDRYFRPLPIDRADFPPEATFVYDGSTPSVRYGYEPYRAGHTTTTVIDFALCGPGIEAVAFETIDLGFKDSDHNPVAAVFVVR